MDLLNLNEDVVKTMSDKEKREYIKELEKIISDTDGKYNYYKAMQLALKLVINGSYGAFANPYFVVSNKHIANSITMMGRDVILYMLENIENYFYNKWHLDIETHKRLTETYIAFDVDNNAYMLDIFNKIIQNKQYKHEVNYHSLVRILKDWNLTKDRIEEIEPEVINATLKGKEITLTKKYKRVLCDFSVVDPIDGTITGKRDEMDGRTLHFHKEDIITYGDTDSVENQTVINTNNGKYTIEELYNKNIINGYAGETLKGHESVICTDKVLNWNEKELYYANVKRIIRHKVTKEKWKLKTKSGKEIIITNDHSMIVFRNNEKIEIKPCEILKTDKILTIINNI
jgi:DNA polymerase elongation subunit (family B)